MNLWALILFSCWTVTGHATEYVQDVYRGPFFTKNLLKVTSADMNYQRSGYYKTFPALPLGGGKSLLTIRNMADLGVRNVVVEVQGTLDPSQPDHVFLGPNIGGDNVGFANLMGAIHSLRLTAAFKLTVVEPKTEELQSPTPTNPRKFWETYAKLATHYAKLAEKNGVEEFVLGTGLGKAVCQSTPAFNGAQGFQSLIDEVRFQYSGRLRLDFKDEADLVQTLSCFNDFLPYLDSIGVDLPNNPSAQRVGTLLNMMRISAGGKSLDFLISRVAFDGSDQKTKAELFFAQFALLSAGLPSQNLTVGVFDTNPDRMTPLDNSPSVMNKPIFEVLRKWYASSLH